MSASVTGLPTYGILASQLKASFGPARRLLGDMREPRATSAPGLRSYEPILGMFHRRGLTIAHDL